MKVYRQYTMAEARIIQSNLHLSDRDISVMLGRSLAATRKFRQRMGYLKPSSRYTKENNPMKRGVVHAGMFKKGNIPVNKRNVGDVFTKLVSGKRRTYIITETSRLYPYQKFLYEQHHNVKLDVGKKVVFLDKDITNFSIDNLAVRTGAEIAASNSNPTKGHETRRHRLHEMAVELSEYGIKGK